MLCFLRRIGQALNNSLQSEIVYIDLSKAFDTVSHSLSLHKLAVAGVNDSLFQWFTDYLTNRSQKVLIKSATLSSLPVLSGVPQGGILRSLLFLSYINDLSDELPSSTLASLFADDTKLVRIIHSESDITNFQRDIDKVFDWSTKWRMKFNLDKYEAVRVTRKKSTIQGTKAPLILEITLFLKPTPKKILVLLLTTISNGVPTSFPRHPKPNIYWGFFTDHLTLVLERQLSALCI